MTPQESRENYIDALFSERELFELKETGIYEDYVEGRVSIDAVCSFVKDQGV